MLNSINCERFSETGEPTQYYCHYIRTLVTMFAFLNKVGEGGAKGFTSAPVLMDTH